MLFSTTLMKSITDKLAPVRRALQAIALRDDVSSFPDGSIQEQVNEMSDAVVDGLNVEASLDLLPQFNVGATALTFEDAVAFLRPAFEAINNHCAKRGFGSVTNFAAYLSYYNGGGGGAKFSALVTPEFATLWKAAIGSTLPTTQSLPAAGVMSPAIHPDIDEDASEYGMGQRAIGGAWVDGDAVDADLYAEVEPLLEVVADFADSSIKPVVEVIGIDDLGGDEPLTWTATLTDSANPASAVSTTMTPAVVAGLETVAIASASGIVPGSVLKVSAGLVDEEFIIVEAMSTAAMHPDINDEVDSEGMGSMSVGGVFDSGIAVDTSLYTEVTPLIEVTTDFADSSDPPVIRVAGIDHTGSKAITGATNASPIVITSVAHGLTNGTVVLIADVLGNDAANGYFTVANKTDDTFELDGSTGDGAYTSGGNIYMTWSVTLDADNPVTAVSTTITPAITVAGRQTVAFASASGIKVGSVLKISAGLASEEYIVVEGVSSANITAVFTKTHLAGAAVAGKRTYALTGSIAGRRLRQAKDITITAADATAGAVRVVGKQDDMITAVFTKDHAAGSALTGKRTYALTPAVAGRRLQNATSMTITATSATAGTVRVVGRRDRVGA